MVRRSKPAGLPILEEGGYVPNAGRDASQRLGYSEAGHIHSGSGFQFFAKNSVIRYLNPFFFCAPAFRPTDIRASFGGFCL